MEAFLRFRSPRVTARTLDADRHHLKLFLEFCGSEGLTRIQEVESHHLAAYYHQLLQRPGRKSPQISSSFLCHAWYRVEHFFRWAVQKDLLLRSPVLEGSPKRREILPKPLSANQVKQLFGVPDTTTPIGLRDQLILELLYGLGLRRTECCRLNLESLDLKGCTVLILGKGGHLRRLPLGQSLMKCLEDYLHRGRPEFGPEPQERALLLRLRSGRRLGGTSLCLRVRKMARAIGLHLTPHQLRHAFASHMLARGASLRRLQEFLGHRCPKSTDRYARVCPLDLHQEFRRCHPRAHHRSSPDT